MTDPQSAENEVLLNVVAGALADHRDGYEPDDLPTEFHGYAVAVIAALVREGYRVIPQPENRPGSAQSDAAPWRPATGHAPTETADFFGGYLCECGESWSWGHDAAVRVIPPEGGKP